MANSDGNSEPTLIPQPNGKGALLSGGMPGNKGGGRPRDVVKELSRLEYEKRIPTLGDIADDDDAKDRDRISAINTLAKHSDLGDNRDYDHELVTMLGAATAEVLHGLDWSNPIPLADADPDVDSIMNRLSRAWKKELGAYVRGT